ncbi:MAG: sodium/glutamate symporter [[Clostridium] scindens]
MPVDIIKDFAYAGFLLLVGYILRYKVPFLQKLYIPASVIGGIIGLLLGSQVLGRISSVSLSFSENISAFAMPLLAVVFATQADWSKIQQGLFEKRPQCIPSEFRHGMPAGWPLRCNYAGFHSDECYESPNRDERASVYRVLWRSRRASDCRRNL